MKLLNCNHVRKRRRRRRWLGRLFDGGNLHLYLVDDSPAKIRPVNGAEVGATRAHAVPFNRPNRPVPLGRLLLLTLMCLMTLDSFESDLDWLANRWLSIGNNIDSNLLNRNPSDLSTSLPPSLSLSVPVSLPSIAPGRLCLKFRDSAQYSCCCWSDRSDRQHQRQLTSGSAISLYDSGPGCVPHINDTCCSCCNGVHPRPLQHLQPHQHQHPPPHHRAQVVVENRCGCLQTHKHVESSSKQNVILVAKEVSPNSRSNNDDDHDKNNSNNSKKKNSRRLGLHHRTSVQEPSPRCSTKTLITATTGRRRPGKILVADANQEANRLYEDLMMTYNRIVRPVAKESDKVVVRLGLKLSQLIDVNLKNQIMTTNVWLNQEWYDYKLKWDPSEYGGMEDINLPAEQIWLPDIVLYNSAEGHFAVSQQIMTRAKVHFDGRVTWNPPAIFRSSCQIDITYFPFDSQTCKLKFGSWTFGTKIDLRHINDTEHEIEKGTDLSEYYQNVEWDIMKASAQRNNITYTCCPDDFYLDVTFTFQLRRKPLFYTVNLIVPAIGITIFSFLVFYLPSDSGEKVTLTISIMVSLIFFLSVLIETIPSTSLAMPLLGKYLCFTLILITLSVCATVFVLNIHFRTPSTHSMPSWVKRWCIDNPPKFLCMNAPQYLSDQQQNILPEQLIYLHNQAYATPSGQVATGMQSQHRPSSSVVNNGTAASGDQRTSMQQQQQRQQMFAAGDGHRGNVSGMAQLDATKLMMRSGNNVDQAIADAMPTTGIGSRSAFAAGNQFVGGVESRQQVSSSSTHTNVNTTKLSPAASSSFLPYLHSEAARRLQMQRSRSSDRDQKSSSDTNNNNNNIDIACSSKQLQSRNNDMNISSNVSEAAGQPDNYCDRQQQQQQKASSNNNRNSQRKSKKHGQLQQDQKRPSPGTVAGNGRLAAAQQSSSQSTSSFWRLFRGKSKNKGTKEPIKATGGFNEHEMATSASSSSASSTRPSRRQEQARSKIKIMTSSDPADHHHHNSNGDNDDDDDDDAELDFEHHKHFQARASICSNNLWRIGPTRRCSFAVPASNYTTYYRPLAQLHHQHQHMNLAPIHAHRHLGDDDAGDDDDDETGSSSAPGIGALVSAGNLLIKPSQNIGQGPSGRQQQSSQRPLALPSVSAMMQARLQHQQQHPQQRQQMPYFAPVNSSGGQAAAAMQFAPSSSSPYSTGNTNQRPAVVPFGTHQQMTRSRSIDQRLYTGAGTPGGGPSFLPPPCRPPAPQVIQFATGDTTSFHRAQAVSGQSATFGSTGPAAAQHYHQPPGMVAGSGRGAGASASDLEWPEPPNGTQHGDQFGQSGHGTTQSIGRELGRVYVQKLQRQPTIYSIRSVTNNGGQGSASLQSQVMRVQQQQQQQQQQPHQFRRPMIDNGSISGIDMLRRSKSHSSLSQSQQRHQMDVNRTLTRPHLANCNKCNYRLPVCVDEPQSRTGFGPPLPPPKQPMYTYCDAARAQQPIDERPCTAYTCDPVSQLSMAPPASICCARPSSLLHSNQQQQLISSSTVQQTNQFNNLMILKLMAEVDKAIQNAMFIAQHIDNYDEFESVKENWKYIAMVIDRIFLYIFLIACIVGTVAIFAMIPLSYIYEEPIDLHLTKLMALNLTAANELYSGACS